MIVGIISWLVLTIVVGAVAESIGRSFFKYFFISLILSPLIGFIILAIKGKATEKDILDENSHIFYCPDCKNTYGGFGNNEEFCPDCNVQLIETTVLTSDWRKYSSEQKDSLKHGFETGKRIRYNIEHNSQVIEKQNSDADEIMKLKKLLDDGAITQEEYNIAKKKLLGI